MIVRLGVDAYLEVGQKKTFAGAIEWPGWTRGGSDEDAALQALLEYAPRYARVLEGAGIAFVPPGAQLLLTIRERLQGNASTDFGAPGKAPASDDRPLDDAGLQRLQAILQACWRAFDAVVAGAAGKELRTGPRGGGRDLPQIVRHVEEAQRAYAARLGRALADDEGADPLGVRRLLLGTLRSAAHGEIAERGPRGGMRWKPRYFVRRAAWHVLDHAWEIEDRM